MNRTGKKASISALANIPLGLTGDLSASSHRSFRLLVDGPYGTLDTTHYDIIVFVAHRYWNRGAVATCSRLVLRRGSVGRKTKIIVTWVAFELFLGE